MHPVSQCRGAFFNGLDLTQNGVYANLVKVSSRGNPGAIRVIPGDRENSYLFTSSKAGPASSGVRMPRTGPRS